MALANGTYWVVSAAGTGLRLDVSGGSAKDGANIEVYSPNVGNAQIFNVTNNGDGKAIVSRYSGKAVDVKGGSLSAGTNVQQWKRNTSRAQIWTITEDGGTITVNGSSYSTYKVALTADTTLLMTSAGTASGSNVTIQKSNGSANQRWAFVPVPSFIDGGVYEIHSMLDTKMCLDVASASEASGANVILYTSNGKNNQKFAIYENSDGYSIRAMHSNMYLDVEGGKASTKGTNVQQYASNSGRAQRWRVTTYGTQTYNGVPCTVVTFGAGNQNTCLMDVTGAKTTNRTNIDIWTANYNNNQKFLLYPTDLEDPLVPVPSNIRFASTDSSIACAKDGETASLQIRFNAPSSWAGSGAAHFEHRIRRRLCNSHGQWASWGEFGEWQASLVEMSNNVATLSPSISYEMDKDQVTIVQWQLQVRCVNVDESKPYSANVHGGTADGLLTLYCEPTVTFSDATWSPLGLKIPYTSDWDASTIRLTSSSQWHRQYEHVGSKNGTIVVPYGNMVGVPSANDSMTLSWRSGLSYTSAFPTRTTTLAIRRPNDNIGETYSSDGYNESVTVSGSGEKHVWVGCDGSLYECQQTASGVFDIPYPMGKPYTVYVTRGNLASSSAREPIDRKFAAWTTADGSFYAPLVIRDSFTRDSEQESEKRALDSRTEMTTDFGSARTTEISLSVRLYGLDGEATVGEMRSLIGTHCIFRAPDGGVDNVSVDGIGETYRGAGVYDLSVTMTKEAR